MKRAILLFFSYIFAISVIGQNNLISNTSDCAGTRPPFAFNIQKSWTSKTQYKVDTRHTPIVGDIDDDGNVEVFASNGLPGGGGILYVFEGKNGALAGQINCPGIGTTYSNGFILFKRNASAKGTVFIAGRNGVLYLYEVRNSTRPLQFDIVWTKSLNVGNILPVVADLNGDGNVEIIAGSYILDANTGNLLSTLPSGTNPFALTLEQTFPLLADVDKDGLAEVILGSDVYKFNTGFVANPTYWKRCPGFTNMQSGANMVGDINQDGNIDIVFESVSSSRCSVYVWTPLTNTIVDVFSFQLQNSVSYPFIGDIDGIVINGKKYPEICINNKGLLMAYTFNGTSLVPKWTMTHSDMSGGTSLTLFDFNLDGVVELVYRDQSHLHIFNGSGNTIVDATTPIPCGSATIVETPIIADVTGDGSADIIVTGDTIGANNTLAGEVNVFEGAASKWSSCPNVWNQQLYSPLLVNIDLTIPTSIRPHNLTFHLANGDSVQYYNGGPMQAPYISDETYLPIDLSPDLYVVNGTIELLSNTSVKLTVTFGNQGLVTAPANSPIRYYKNAMIAGNILGNETLGVDLAPGQTHTIVKTLSGLGNPMPSQFYVRILDDGTNFPALGTFSDCNLTNNHKSFGTLELLKTANSLNACVDGTIIFDIKLINNTAQTNSPQTFYNLVLVDSLGTGWEYLSANTNDGTLSSYNPTTRKILWRLDSIANNDTVELIITAKAINAGAIRNTIWIDSINNMLIGREIIEAYVIVNSTHAPVAAVISPNTANVCNRDSVLLTSSISNASSYQWFRNNIELVGDTHSSCWAKLPGNYTVTYFDGICVSQMSTAAVITNNQVTETMITVSGSTKVCHGKNTTLTASVSGITGTVKWYSSQTTSTPFHTGTKYVTSNLTADTTFYIAAYNNNYCENDTGKRTKVTVSLFPPLTGGTIGTSQTYCYGIMPLIYLGGQSASGGSGNVDNYAYQWESSTNGQTWSNLNISAQEYGISSLTQTTYYRRIVTDICGTAYSNTIQITINPLPVVSSERAELCVGITTTLFPDTGGIWTSSNSSIVEITNNKIATGKSAGTVTLTYTSSATGCIETIPMTVNEFPLVPDETTGDNVVCLGNSVQLSNATPGGTWMINNANAYLTDPNANPVTVTGVTAGKTYVTYTVSNGICQTKITFLLKVISNTPPKVSIGIER